jgi:hypothetical protein
MSGPAGAAPFVWTRNSAVYGIDRRSLPLGLQRGSLGGARWAVIARCFWSGTRTSRLPVGRQLGRFRAIAGRRWELEQPHQIQGKHACRDLTRLDGPVEHKRLMGFEPTTFCMASSADGYDGRRRRTLLPAFRHGSRRLRGLPRASLPGRLGHYWATTPAREMQTECLTGEQLANKMRSL